MSPAHECIMSEMMQLAGGRRCRSLAASGSRSAPQAKRKLLKRSLDGSMSTFSQPSGRPNSAAGKGSSTSCTGRPASSTPAANPSMSFGSKESDVWTIKQSEGRNFVEIGLGSHEST
uniref:Uncharacterized protein n=1 Tax=Oryza nivara TaxID=4536 RepID=A0A0E0FH15_ORYNI